MKLGSLFDGIGGFPAVARRYGITPVWASEVEPACISITRKHFPQMKHLGDITQINGAEIEPVDIITFGSPCQDLSVAGKRAGLAGARSGLFGEAIRIIEEMRGKTDDRYPTWVVWENVPGALSSGNGLDFRAVLQSFANTEIPMPGAGRWAGAGMVRGGRCDCGWRVLDAQYWGVPQRRRRIFLVADFAGRRAAEVLFKLDSLQGDFAAGGETGQGLAGSVGNGLAPANDNLRSTAGRAGRVAVNDNLLWPQVTGTLCASGAGLNRPAGQGNELDLCIVLNDQGGQYMDVSAGVVGTLRAETHGNVPAVFSRQRSDEFTANDVVSTQSARQYKDATDLIVAAVDCRNHKELGDLSGTLCSKQGYSLNYQNPVRQGQAVRRLTPVECERLQGFEDGWTAIGHNGKPITDSKRYAALGNSVALPCVDYILRGIVAANDN